MSREDEMAERWEAEERDRRGFDPGDLPTEPANDNVLPVVSRKAVTSSSASKAARRRLLTLGELMGNEDWLENEPPPIECVFSKPAYHEPARRDIGAMPRGQVWLVCADGGCGKTFAAIGACMAVATGAAWLGEFKVNYPGTAVGLFGESVLESMRLRIHFVAASMGLSVEQRRQLKTRFVPKALADEEDEEDETGLRVVALDNKGNYRRTQAFAELYQELSGIGDLRLVVFDTLARTGSTNAEESQAGATETFRAYERIARLPSKPLVLVLHHTGKQGGRAGASFARGVSALRDNARGVWGMRPARDAGEFTGVIEVCGEKGNEVEREKFSTYVQRRKGGALYSMTEEEKEDYRTALEDAEQASEAANQPRGGFSGIERPVTEKKNEQGKKRLASSRGRKKDRDVDLDEIPEMPEENDR